MVLTLTEASRWAAGERPEPPTAADKLRWRLQELAVSAYVLLDDEDGRVELQSRPGGWVVFIQGYVRDKSGEWRHEDPDREAGAQWIADTHYDTPVLGLEAWEKYHQAEAEVSA